MNITMLGTGNALATECYNTCFVLSFNGENILIDGGGGNGLLHRLKHAGFELSDIHDVFITHAHIDHLLGIIWLIRIAAQNMNRGMFDGDMNIYSHDEVTALLGELTHRLLLPYQADFVGRRIHLRKVNDREIRTIAGREFTFFDIHSARTKQYGFTVRYDGDKRLTCCGDEPLASGVEIFFHCPIIIPSIPLLPYEKHHSTVRDACELAQRLGVKNLLLYHTEDSDLLHRKERYTDEGRKYFAGNIFVPDDLETITIA